EAYTCSAYSLPFYPAKEPSSETSNGAAEPPPEAPATGASGASGASESWVRGLLQRLPIRGRLRTAMLAPARLRHEPHHLPLSRQRLEGTSALVVAGGGQLDDVWGGFLGHPYVLYRWSRIARDVGARYCVASVGTGHLSAASHMLVTRALSSAAYRSYRDE